MAWEEDEAGLLRLQLMQGAQREAVGPDAEVGLRPVAEPPKREPRVGSEGSQPLYM